MSIGPTQQPYPQYGTTAPAPVNNYGYNHPGGYAPPPPTSRYGQQVAPGYAPPLHHYHNNENIK